MAPLPIGPEARERFWSKTRPDGECLRWIGAQDPKGYGNFCLVASGRKVWIKAHRVAYIVSKGDIPAGLLLLHSCDNPWCVNPEHLRPGTALDNARDHKERGTYVNQNTVKDACQNGHPFDAANTRIVRSHTRNRTYRGCRACAANRYQQKRGAA